VFKALTWGLWADTAESGTRPVSDRATGKVEADTGAVDKASGDTAGSMTVGRVAPDRAWEDMENRALAGVDTAAVWGMRDCWHTLKWDSR